MVITTGYKQTTSLLPNIDAVHSGSGGMSHKFLCFFIFSQITQTVNWFLNLLIKQALKASFTFKLLRDKVNMQKQKRRRRRRRNNSSVEKQSKTLNKRIRSLYPRFAIFCRIPELKRRSRNLLWLLHRKRKRFYCWGNWNPQREKERERERVQREKGNCNLESLITHGHGPHTPGFSSSSSSKSKITK